MPPVYEYLCSTCQKRREVRKSFDDYNREERCPECKELMERSYSKTNFQLKGGGWAKDGYAKPKN